MEERQSREFDNGVINSIKWFSEGITLGYAVTTFNSPGTLIGESKDNDVRLHLGLRGNYRFYHRQLDRTFDFIGGHHNILFSNGFEMRVENRTMELETFGIRIPVELFVKLTSDSTESLKRFTEQIVEGRASLFSEQWGTITPSIQTVVRQILNSHYTPELKKLFLFSKSIELIVLVAETCNAKPGMAVKTIKTSSDMERIIAVRDLINARLDSPPSLSEVARIVGLNEYKLKRGFKEVFGSTVFGFLTEERLQLAFQYLKDTEKTAAEISYLLGYSSPQHFNNSFKARFGITPDSVRNNT